MKFKKYILITISISVFVCAVSVLVGYLIFGPGRQREPDGSGGYVNASENKPSADPSSRSMSIPAANETSAPTPEPIRIHSGTKIIYEYYYLGDGNIETSTEAPPYFLLDMREDEVAKQFMDWQIIEFTDKQVVLRKNFPGVKEHSYILGIKDNYVAVFYQTAGGQGTVKETTSMPIQALSPDEQQKLKEGIEITGDEQLAKALEDYGS